MSYADSVEFEGQYSPERVLGRLRPLIGEKVVVTAHNNSGERPIYYGKLGSGMMLGPRVWAIHDEVDYGTSSVPCSETPLHDMIVKILNSGEAPKVVVSCVTE